ncbi:Carboxylesterase [Zopfochytrium polystomum]|nr:Carboxylesterase [Zopfochytrium polystomum]
MRVILDQAVFGVVLAFAAVSTASARPGSPAPTDPLTIKLPSGTFVGTNLNPLNDSTVVRAHLGIPYAQPPVGSLRFYPPAPITENLGVRDAKAFGYACIQLTATGASTANVPTSEDCLTINVWTPADASEWSRLPVMVWVHGGGFGTGSSADYTFDGGRLSATQQQLGYKAIVVSFNYRLNVFGTTYFPALDDIGGTNIAIQDQIAAFTWVRENIASFGGDQNRITAIGESAGSKAVAFLQTAPISQLFSKAIMMSGGVGNAYLPDKDLVYEFMHAKVAAAVNCTSNDLACLQAVPARALAAAALAVPPLQGSISDGTKWGPYVGGPLAPEIPLNRLLSGRFNHVPILIGDVSNEGTVFTTTVSSEEKRTAFFNGFFAGEGGLEGANLTEATATIQRLYPLSSYNNTPNPSWWSAADLQGDMNYQCPVQQFADAYARALLPVYRYHFNIQPGPAQNASLGVYHSYDNSFLFNNPHDLTTVAQQTFARELIAMYTSFADHGSPNGAVKSLPYWPPYYPTLPLGGGKRMRYDGPGQYAVEVDDVRTEKCGFLTPIRFVLSSKRKAA